MIISVLVGCAKGSTHPARKESRCEKTPTPCSFSPTCPSSQRSGRKVSASSPKTAVLKLGAARLTMIGCPARTGTESTSLPERSMNGAESGMISS